MHWLTTLHTDSNKDGVYLVRVWDRNNAMNEICVDTRTCESEIYDCSELYSMTLSVGLMRICCCEGNHGDFYRVGDVCRVLANINYTGCKDKVDRKRCRFHEKKAEKHAVT